MGCRAAANLTRENACPGAAGGLGFGLNDLGIALALGADGGGFLLAVSLHLGKGAVERRAIGQVGARQSTRARALQQRQLVAGEHQ